MQLAYLLLLLFNVIGLMKCQGMYGKRIFQNFHLSKLIYIFLLKIYQHKNLYQNSVMAIK
jgi:hypothetical protein